MRIFIRKDCTLLLAILLLSNTCVSAFVPNRSGQIQTNRPVLRRSSYKHYRKEQCAHADVHSENKNELRDRGYALWKRLDTLEAAGLTQSDVGSKRNGVSSANTKVIPLLSSATTLGFVGHTGLLLVSTLIINIIKALFFTKPPTEEEELLASSGDAPQKQSGIMDRCPWPFIFFHDPKQGMKDLPTWVMVCWYCLYRIWKYRSAAGVV